MPMLRHKISNDVTLYLKELEKDEKAKLKGTIRKEIKISRNNWKRLKKINEAKSCFFLSEIDKPLENKDSKSEVKEETLQLIQQKYKGS